MHGAIKIQGYDSVPAVTVCGARSRADSRRLSALILNRFVFYVFILTSPLTAQETAPGDAPAEIQVRTSVSPNEVRIGDRVTYRVEIVGEIVPPDSAGSLLPPFPDRWAGLPVLDESRSVATTAQGQPMTVVEVTLRADRVGVVEFPEVELISGGSGEGGDRETKDDSEILATGAAVRLEVISVLPPEVQDVDIRDIKPLREIGGGWPWWRGVLLAVALGILVLALLRWWAKRRARIRVEEQERLLSAHEWAFRRLEELRRTDFTHLEDLRRYYFDLSLVLRTYIERRFAVNATDLTTEEILARTRRVSGLDLSLQRRLAGFLMATDMVKYAAQVPAAAEIDETFEAAFSFVEQTVPPPAVTTEDGASDAGGRAADVPHPETVADPSATAMGAASDEYSERSESRSQPDSDFEASAGEAENAGSEGSQASGDVPLPVSDPEPEERTS